jgi:hypothetical protein
MPHDPWPVPPTSLLQTQIMQQAQRLTAIIEREGDGFVSFCPELDVARQGPSIEEARANLVARRFHREVFVTQVEVPVG